MASFSIEDFVGNGSLRELLPKLLDEGWDDVPTLKIMNSEDMDEIGLTRLQKDALEIRSYLHDRALMQYGDLLEASGKGLPELLSLSTPDLSSQYGMKRGHIARFMDRTTTCAADPLPALYTVPTRRRNNLASRNSSIYRSPNSSANSRKLQSMTRYSGRSSPQSDFSLEQSLASFKIKDGYVFKGVVAAMPAEPRACGCVQPPPIVENVAPYSAIENVSIQKLTPEYKIGMERLIKNKTPPMKASELWREKPAILVCIRRPGYSHGHHKFQQFIERNFGDWAPHAEVIEICNRIQVSIMVHLVAPDADTFYHTVKSPTKSLHKNKFHG